MLRAGGEFGYDSSQGYTAFEDDQPPRPSYWQRRRAQKAAQRAKRQAHLLEQHRRQLDRILQKVHQGGIQSLTLKEKRMRSGVLRVVERKLYPGYVFVEMACEDDGSVAEDVWFLIKETTGVGDFIGADGRPTSMPEHDVVQMLAASEKADEEPSLSGLNIGKGDQVKITDGAFESYEGEVEVVDERRGMVSVIVSIFGRMTPVEVGYWQLEKVE